MISKLNEDPASGSDDNSRERRGSWRLRDQAQALAVPASVAVAIAALYPFTVRSHPPAQAWGLLFVALAVAIVGLIAVPVSGTAVAAPGAPVGRVRRLAGIAVFLFGAALWCSASRWLYLDWRGNFDRAWLGWLSAAGLMCIGLDLAWARWGPQWRPRRPLQLVAMLLALFGVAAAYRFGNLWEFPGPYGITQIEDLQFGNWGAKYLAGDRNRWEFIGHAWSSALGIWLYGPSLGAIRVVYALITILNVIAVFVWLRYSVGTVGALFGAGLLAVSSWDVVLSRTPFNPNALVVSTAFALLVGPAARGRPAAFVCHGLMLGYILWEYIAYRPLVPFVLAGGLLFSLRDRSVGWAARFFRPALAVVMIATLVAPLFLNRLHGRVMHEYLDGLNRATAVERYYDSDQSWQETFDKRLQRVKRTVLLFFFRGDDSPARNFGGRPLVDPFSALAMLIGFGFAISHWRHDLFGLFAVAFVLTTAGATVVTGDFNAMRMMVTMPYLYFFAGCAGAALATTWARAWGRVGSILAVCVLVATFVAAAADNARFLRGYWASETVRRYQRNNHALLADWLRSNVKSGEQVIGVAPTIEYTLRGGDAAWLRGPPVPGFLSSDVETALRGWKQQGPTVLLAMSWKATPGIQRYLEFLMPGLEMDFVDDPLDARGELAFARLDERPPALERRLEEVACLGIRGEYEIVPKQGAPVKIERVVPFIDKSTWPPTFAREFAGASPAEEVRVRFAANFEVEESAPRRFWTLVYPGSLTLEIDGVSVDTQAERDVALEAGMHSLELVAVFPPMPKGFEISVYWEGPETGQRRELMPFYRIAAQDGRCPPPATGAVVPLQ